MRKFCLGLYMAYFLTIASQAVESLSLVGGILLLFLPAIGKMRAKEAAGTVWETHLLWMSRTFWIGSLYTVISLVASFVLIFGFTGIGEVIARSGPENLQENISAFTKDNAGMIQLFTVGPMMPALLWWLYRCWTGFTLAQEEKPVENVMKWT